MMRFLLFVALTLSTLGLANATVGAAELTGSTEAQSSDAKMPAGADFSNGPAGGGAQLIGTDHVPSGAEFGNGPTGGAAVDPTPRRMPTGSEFSNGPTGISKE
jgi:hypothetical protein